jgi:hypothetical protein
MMPKEIKRSELVHIQTTKDGRCVDMLLTMKEIEKGMDRFIDPKNESLRPSDCCTCWPIEKPPKCTFWDRILFKCSENKE